jgi:hypothetical protein
LRGGQKSKMLAEQDKCGNVPAHDKNSNGHSHNGATDGANMPQIFRSKKQCIGTKAFHEITVHYTEHNEPENQQYLIFSEMQENELNG